MLNRLVFHLTDQYRVIPDQRGLDIIVEAFQNSVKKVRFSFQ